MQTNRRDKVPDFNSGQADDFPALDERGTLPPLEYRKPKSSKKLVIIGVLTVAIIALVAGVFWFQNAQKGSEKNEVVTPRPVLTVSIEPAQINSVRQEVKVTGSVWARDPLTIAAESSGFHIDSVLVDEGQQVKKGQVLAILNSSVLTAELERERAQLASAEAALKKSFQPNRREDINALRAVVAAAKASAAQQQAVKVQAIANLQNARSNAKRYADLNTQGAVSTQEAESKDTICRVAEAELHNAEEKIHAADFVLKQAQERLALAESGGRIEDVDIAKAEVQRCKANVHRLEALIAQTVIKAPSNGLITRRDAHIGDTPIAGKSLFLMIRDNKIEIRAQVPEKDLALLQPGQSVSIASPAVSKKVEGKLREIGPMVDPDTRLCTVRIDVPTDSGLKPGMFAEGRVKLDHFRALTVPSRAVISKDDHYLVFVFEPSTGKGASPSSGFARLRFIQPGARTGDFIEVRSGVTEGEQIITNGAGFLKDGDPVESGK